MFVIGLTGGIGTGKSSVCRVLGTLGAAVVDADAVAHAAYEPGAAAWRSVVDAFGEAVLDCGGRIDRKRLGDIVFNDRGGLRKLNAIVHPDVRRRLEERIRELDRAGADVVVIEVPLLVEAIREGREWAEMLDEVWVVAAPEDRIIQRVWERSRMGEAAARSRMESQASDRERIEYADAVIDNGGSLDGLRNQVCKLWRERVPHK